MDFRVPPLKSLFIKEKSREEERKKAKGMIDKRGSKCGEREESGASLNRLEI